MSSYLYPTPLICVIYFLNSLAVDRNSIRIAATTCSEIIREQVRTYCNCFKIVAGNPVTFLGYGSKTSPEKALRASGGWCSQILRQSAHEGGKVVSCTHRLPLPPQEIFLVLISVGD
jgi:hypothetical protein